MTSHTARTALLALLLSCSPPRPVVGGPGAPQVIWLSETNVGYAAQQAWDMPLSVLPDFQWLPGPQIPEACNQPPTSALDGCAYETSGRVLLRNDMKPNRIPVVVLHELGHLVGHNSGHLPTELCLDIPSDHVMCDHGSRLPELTSEDRAWAAAGVVEWRRERGQW